jgi:hypothetical protein
MQSVFTNVQKRPYSAVYLFVLPQMYVRVVQAILSDVMRPARILSDGENGQPTNLLYGLKAYGV